MEEPQTPDLYRQLVHSAPDAVMVTDAQGKITLWNPGAEEVFGYTAEEALGQTLDIIIPERLRNRHWEGFRQTMDTGLSRYGAKDLLTVPAYRRDGSQFSCEFSIAPLRGEDGRLVGMGAILRDITARRNEEKALRERLAALEELT
jgi:nitric oxide dioxygenase